jgi:hypothetical protein
MSGRRDGRVARQAGGVLHVVVVLGSLGADPIALCRRVRINNRCRRTQGASFLQVLQCSVRGGTASSLVLRQETSIQSGPNHQKLP